MVRKNEDEKKLKLNQPILSVRRSDEKRKIEDDSSSLHSVPQPGLYRSESKLDPVRSPGVVPFVWEESPGKPKDGGVKLQRVVPRLLSVTNSEISEAENDDESYAETGDFMIGLFLPATKTMASETPVYVPGKQLPRPVAKAERQLEPGSGWHCYQSHDCEDDEHKHETLFPAKACGVVPRLCVRSSIFILNPVPAMTVKTRVHTSPRSRIPRYSFARSCTGLNDERPTSGLTKQKSQGNAHSELLQTQGFGANPRLDALRTCKKFSRKLQELLADHSGSTREHSSPVLGSDSPVTKMKPQHKPIAKPFVQETVGLDLLWTKSGELTITSLDSDSEEEDDERCIKQEALTRKLKQSQEMMHLEVPASPPLPNSPSDSWLFRTLPSFSTKTSPHPSSEVQSGDPHSTVKHLQSI